MREIEKYEQDYLRTDNPANRFEELYQIRYRKRNVNRQMEKYKHQSILEIGCGMDSQANSMKEIVQYTIVEPGCKFLEKARADLQGRQVIFIEGEVQEKIKELKLREYDFIIIGSLLHEIEKPNEFLEAVKVLCNEKTVVHVNVPNAKSMHRVLAMESDMVLNIYSMSERNITMQQNSIFDSASLRKLVEDAGGVILEEGSYFVKPFTHEQMMKCLELGIVDEKIMDGFEKLIYWMPEMGSELFVDFCFSGKDCKCDRGRNMD